MLEFRALPDGVPFLQGFNIDSGIPVARLADVMCLEAALACVVGHRGC